MSDTQATSNFRLSLKAKINIGIVAYIIVAFSMLGWINSARGDYIEARRETQRETQKRQTHLSQCTGCEDCISKGSKGYLFFKYGVDLTPKKPFILHLDDVIAFACMGAFIGAGWLGLQLLAIIFRNTLRMGARAIAEGKAEAAERRSTSPEVTVED